MMSGALERRSPPDTPRATPFHYVCCARIYPRIFPARAPKKRILFVVASCPRVKPQTK